MSRSIYHNRPYVEIIRGKHEMDKFQIAMRAYNYKTWDGEMPGHHLYQQTNQVDRNLRDKFRYTKLDSSGFIEGIYTYEDDDHYLYFPDRKPVEKTLGDGVTDKLGDHNPGDSRQVQTSGTLVGDEVSAKEVLQGASSIVTDIVGLVSDDEASTDKVKDRNSQDNHHSNDESWWKTRLIGM